MGSHKSRSSSSSIVLAKRYIYPSDEERPCQVHFYARHAPCINGSSVTFLLFYATWFKPHRDVSLYGKPVSIWESDVFELSDTYSLLPVQFIQSRTVSLVDKLPTNETVLFVCSII